MILKEAMIGGVYYPEYIESEMALPESERVALVYRALTNRERIMLIDSAKNVMPDPAQVCLTAVTQVRNVTGSKGEQLDTIEKLLNYNDAGHQIDYLIVIAGREIWRRQGGSAEMLKNFEQPSTAGAKAISTKEQPDS